MDIDSLPLQDLYSIIQDNPGLLRRPIILDDKRLQVGYNEDEIYFGFYTKSTYVPITRSATFS